MTRAWILAAMMLLSGAAFTWTAPVYADEPGGEAEAKAYLDSLKPFCNIQVPEPPKKEEPPKPAADGTATAAPVVAPKPVVVPEMRATCASDKVQVVITARHYGWQIGDVIPINFVFTVPEGIKLNTDRLMQGKLALAPDFKPTFEMVGKPIIVMGKQAGATVYDVTIEVRQFEIKPILSFTMQIPFSRENLPDGSPKWEPFTTPAYLLLNSIDGGYENVDRPLVSGNTAPVKPRTAALVPVMWVIIVLLLLPWPLIAMVRYSNRTRPRRSMSRDAAAWLALHQVIKSGKQIGFGVPHYSRMGEVLRKYFSTEYTGLQGMTQTEIEALPDEPRANLLKSVFRKLDRVLIGQKSLTVAEQAQLVNELEQLIKRPYSM